MTPAIQASLVEDASRIKAGRHGVGAGDEHPLRSLLRVEAADIEKRAGERHRSVRVLGRVAVYSVIDAGQFPCPAIVNKGSAAGIAARQGTFFREAVWIEGGVKQIPKGLILKNIAENIFSPARRSIASPSQPKKVLFKKYSAPRKLPRPISTRVWPTSSCRE